MGLENTVIEGVEFDDDAAVMVVHVRPTASRRGRCGTCQRRGPGFDHGAGRRRWRALDLGTVQAFVEADAPRVACRRHGVTVASVPWARHDAGHTRAFDDTVAWLATVTSKTAATRLMRVAWRTVGSIITRVWADTGGATDRLAGVTRIGIDEISYRRGMSYLTVVVDHDTSRLLWAAQGRDRATLRAFFDVLGETRSAGITHVSADGADWIAMVVAERCPKGLSDRLCKGLTSTLGCYRGSGRTRNDGCSGQHVGHCWGGPAKTRRGRASARGSGARRPAHRAGSVAGRGVAR